MVQTFTYKLIKCKIINVYLDVFINWVSKQCTRYQKYQRILMEYLHFIFDLSMNNQLQINCILYYYLDQLNDSLIVWWWFANRDFFGVDWRFIQLLRTIDCWWLVKRCTGCCWACDLNFQGNLKQFSEKKSIKKVPQFVYRIEGM